jgi:hypothetical protein
MGRLAQRYDEIPTLRMKRGREGSGPAGGRQAPGKSNACVEAVWKGAPLASTTKTVRNFGKRAGGVQLKTAPVRPVWDGYCPTSKRAA